MIVVLSIARNMAAVKRNQIELQHLDGNWNCISCTLEWRNRNRTATALSQINLHVHKQDKQAPQNSLFAPNNAKGAQRFHNEAHQTAPSRKKYSSAIKGVTQTPSCFPASKQTKCSCSKGKLTKVVGPPQKLHVA